MRKFLLCLCMGWLSFTHSGVCQTNLLERIVSVNKTDTSIQEVLNHLTSNYKINFSYSKDLVSLQQKVTVTAVDLSLKKVLDHIFAGSGIQYTVIGNQIALQKAKKQSPTSAPILKGRVLIFGTDSALASASIYFDGMYKGTVSNKDGYFTLPLSDSSNVPVIVSAIGYSSATIFEYSPKQFLKVYLSPKAYELDEVVISLPDGLSREEKETMFKRAFLGTSYNAEKCTIENISDITLTYKKKSRTLEAFCDKPILIRNPALGYKITYYLDQFFSSDSSASYEGHHYFEDDSLIKRKVRRKIKRNREYAYLGSRMHFIRSLYNKKLDWDGFTVTNSKSALLKADDLLVNIDSQKHLKINDKIRVFYLRDFRLNTYLTKKKDFTFITDKGFYDPAGIVWTGYMALERIGDLLPFEYQLDRK